MIDLCMASIIPSPPYVINSAIIPSSGALFFFVLWIHFFISSHAGVFSSSPSPITLLSVLVPS
jgi:hypothetical protein